jgi:uncharacterized protein YndB with AHSA1/START domain
MNKKITVETFVNASPEKVWNSWTSPEHIQQWLFASDDWHCPKAVNDLKVGGRFSSTMAAKDGSMGFDFGGEYTEVEENKVIAYTMDDRRTVRVTFTPENDGVRVTETFEMESQNPEEMQRGGWQAILDNFKKHTENS